MIEKGRLVASGDVQKIIESVRAHREFVVDLLEEKDADRAAAWVKSRAGVLDVKPSGGTLKIALESTKPEIAALLEGFLAQGIRLTQFREEMVDLETAFMTLTKGELN